MKPHSKSLIHFNLIKSFEYPVFEYPVTAAMPGWKLELDIERLKLGAGLLFFSGILPFSCPDCDVGISADIRQAETQCPVKTRKCALNFFTEPVTGFLKATRVNFFAPTVKLTVL